MPMTVLLMQNKKLLPGNICNFCTCLIIKIYILVSVIFIFTKINIILNPIKICLIAKKAIYCVQLFQFFFFISLKWLVPD